MMARTMRDIQRQNAAIAIFEAMSVQRSDAAPCA